MNERQLSLQDVGHEWAGMVEAAALQHCSTAALHAAAGGRPESESETGITLTAH